MQTSFTRLVGCTAPVQLAGMPGVVTPELAAAVAGAGGLGMLPATMQTPDGLAAALEAARSSGPGALGVNFLIPFLDPALLDLAAQGSRVVECFYGDPDRALVERIHAGGALAGWQVGSVEEAEAAARAGCDFVVAQGVEAGGHVRGGTALLPLLSRVLDAVSVPVLAAGGLATGRDFAAVLAAGAAGARLGTRLLASAESGAHRVHVEAVVAARATDTELTQAFSGMWPDAPHRVLRRSIEAAQALDGEVVGEVELPTGTLPVHRFSVISPDRDTRGRIEAMALYAGHSVENVDAPLPAAEIVRMLVEDAEARLRVAAAAAG